MKCCRSLCPVRNSCENASEVDFGRQRREPLWHKSSQMSACLILCFFAVFADEAYELAAYLIGDPFPELVKLVTRLALSNQSGV